MLLAVYISFNSRMFRVWKRITERRELKKRKNRSVISLPSLPVEEKVIHRLKAAKLRGRVRAPLSALSMLTRERAPLPPPASSYCRDSFDRFFAHTCRDRFHFFSAISPYLLFLFVKTNSPSKYPSSPLSISKSRIEKFQGQGKRKITSTKFTIARENKWSRLFSKSWRKKQGGENFVGWREGVARRWINQILTIWRRTKGGIYRKQIEFTSYEWAE